LAPELLLDRAGVLVGRRVDADDREVAEVREPELVPFALVERDFELLVDRPGEDVRVTMAGEPTVPCNTDPRSHTPQA
jgi:hypothetical protein